MLKRTGGVPILFSGIPATIISPKAFRVPRDMWVLKNPANIALQVIYKRHVFRIK